ncbi:MAG: hypothetical protein JSR60_18210 [Proteobacteria bacterium]|nr:hypothetical protein [Pseudomonadota bacterium]
MKVTRRLWDWMGTIEAPIGKPWFTTTDGGSPIPNTWQGWSLLVVFALWTFFTVPLVPPSSALIAAYFLLTFLALVIGVWIKTKARS